MEDRRVLVFNGMDAISDFVIGKWIELSKKAISERGRFTVALSGGKTPIPLYKKLAETKRELQWSNINIFLVDERFLPHKHPERSFRMIRENFLRGVNIPEGNIYPLRIKETPGESAETYEKDIIDFFSLKNGEFPAFDLIMLGIGEDGHTAALFPGTEVLLEKQRITSPVISDKVRFRRITLTLPAINNARNIMFLVTGKNKSEAVRKVTEEKDSKMPASLVIPERGSVSFLLDNEAGSLLKKEVSK